MLLLSLFLTATLVSGAGDDAKNNDGQDPLSLIQGLERMFRGIRRGIQVPVWKVRRATNVDKRQLVALDAKLYPAEANLYAGARCTVSQANVWVFEEEHNIVGAVWMKGDHVFSLNIDCQQGSDEYIHAGKALMQFVYDRPQYKDKPLAVHVDEVNQLQQMFMLAVGFKPTGMTQRDGQPQVVMTCTPADRLDVMPLYEVHEMRQAIRADIPALITLDQTVFPEERHTPFNRRMNLSGVTVYLVNGVIAACAYLQGRHIQSIGTLKPYRGKQIAKKLMVHVLTTLRGNPFSLNVDQDNKGAVGWYKKIGFTITDPNYIRGADQFADDKPRKQYVMTLTKLSERYQGYVDAFQPFSVAEL